MINLARAITTAGVALAVSLVAVPSASAVVREAGKTAAAAQSSAPAKKASASAGSKAVKDALASNRPVTVNIYYVLHDGRVISEQGPGDSSAHEVGSNSGAIDMQTQNEPITTGDLNAEQNKGDVTFEVEGSEQDTGEVS
ncbi:hypothetical protein G4Z16_18685 [Streptomyces bathyalis]|uniref:Uncharacterized protein n=1 Tax=Streptomyces bathyalis TaxID=2710756 RepID=A0A7T1T7Z7_9ACTN|nr:hypothetical protein [Streptomyces bathyalis]QPP08092.1 hypothetical protein G4Z16_18685 [Streptomyces bathyalis]